MKPALVFPYNDPDGTMFPHLHAILPDLKNHFERAYISSPPSTLAWLRSTGQILTDNFFTAFPVEEERQIGDHFSYLYQRAAETSHPDQSLHLGYLDRISFALQGTYKDAFLVDINSLAPEDLPLIFQRSEYAWSTHPQNYYELEGIVTTVGKNLFGQELDYAWCHLVVRAGQLREMMPRVKNPDLSMVAEMIFYLQDDIKTRDVDWLAWEDPFIFQREATELKHERQHSLVETRKRLNYVLPMIETLTRLSRNGRK